MPRAIYATTKDSDMLYAIHGIATDPTLYLETDKGKYVFVDHREFDLFKQGGAKSGVEPVLVDRFREQVLAVESKDPFDAHLVRTIFKEYDLLGRDIEVSPGFPLDIADYLRAQGVKLIVKNPLFPERETKSEEEVNEIKQAMRFTCEAYTHIENILREAEIKGDELIYHGSTLTSEYLKSEADRVLLEHNLFLTEGIIIASGAQSAQPHNEGSGLIRPHVPIIVDLFPRHRITGYFADMTRTYVKGEPSEYFRKMYQTELEVQQRALELIKPGASTLEIYKQVSDMFIQAGFDVEDRGFVHGVGHGIGLEVHEVPFITSRHDLTLQPGHIVTVEPGLYYPEHEGVRIEDVIFVNEDGHENLTNYPKEDFIIK